MSIVSATLIVAGAFFFVAGTIGLLRLPDVYTRLHALSKADNLGLGLLVAGFVLERGWSLVSLKLVVTWALVAMASGLGAHLIAGHARAQGIEPWQRR